MTIAPPVGILCELTHRCPLQCPYCSNPLELERAGVELGTEAWCRVLSEAAEMGVIHVHLSGGEPTVRKDLDAIVAHAARAGLYTNLITSGVLLDRSRLERLAEGGLDHVQLSVQGAEPAAADRIAGYRGHAKKLAVARMVRELDLPLTLNAVVHRQNLDQLEELIGLAVELGAGRLEVAHVQYHGWAYRNRAALMPTRAQLEAATATVEAARERLRGILVIDYVVPDYYARRPKACMGGWGRLFLNVTPSGLVLPCHAAQSIPGLRFDSALEMPLARIWEDSEAFRAYRGTEWMPEPCRGCAHREEDWGGCRCQAAAFAGTASATDPACEFSHRHAELVAQAEEDSGSGTRDFTYRTYANAVSPVEA